MVHVAAGVTTRKPHLTIIFDNVQVDYVSRFDSGTVLLICY
jgi:hypothetical protein